MSLPLSVVRTEKKYYLPAVRQSPLLSALSMHMKPDHHSGENGYLVRSLYFDSLFDQDLQDKIDGLELRKKIRLRLYDPQQRQVKLEIKQKQGAAQQKHSMWISRELAQQLICGTYGGLLETGSSLGTELYTLLECGLYRPKCLVEYDRMAFWDETNDTRVTLDSGLRVSRDVQSFFSDAPNFVPVFAGTILEVKYNRFLLSFVKNIVNRANASETAISKYVMCRQALG